MQRLAVTLAGTGGAGEDLDVGVVEAVQQALLPIQLRQQVHVQVGDRARDQRQQHYAPSGGRPNPRSTPAFMTGSQLRTRTKAHIGIWVLSPLGHTPPRSDLRVRELHSDGDQQNRRSETWGFSPSRSRPITHRTWTL